MQSHHGAEGEFVRQARLLLRLVDRPGARLVEAEGLEGWLIESGTSRRRERRRLDDAMVGEMARRDWLARDPSGGYRASAAGRRWLKSAAGGEADGEAFADQHRLIDRRATASRRGAAPQPLVNEAESPLGWLRSRRDKSGEPLISEAQFMAGERLRVDFTVAQLSPRVTSAWDMSVPSGARGRSGARPESLEVNERALAAKQRFLRAVDEVGPELSGILVEVCCLSRGLEAAERRLGWPQRSAKLVLQIALTRLARHYGLIRPEPPRGGRTVIRHWGAEDYRPRTGVPEAGDQP